MFALLSGVILFCLYWCIPEARSQTVNVSTAQAIVSSSGTCLTAYASVDGAPLYFQPCNNELGQQWDISTSGPHILNDGYAIIILSGTDECVDVEGYNYVSPGLFSCGGRTGGTGGQSSNQAFTYSELISATAPRVFVPLSRSVNNGQGPGQTCLSASQDSPVMVSCDPASPASRDVFSIGSGPATTPAQSGSSPITNSPSVNGFWSTITPSTTGSNSQYIVGPGSSSALSGEKSSSTSTTSEAASQVNVKHGSATAPQPSGSHFPTSNPPPSASNASQKHSLNVIAVVLPIIVVALMITFLYLFLLRRRRLAKKSRYGSPQPFLLPATPPTDMMDATNIPPLPHSLKHPGFPSSSAVMPSPAQENRTGGNTTPSRTHTPSPPPSIVETNRNVNHVVSMVAARIDPRPVSSSSFGNSPTTHVNIDTILSLIAARFDSPDRYTEVRDPRDLPPSYPIPPTYEPSLT